jgi:hypothetical protein
LKFNIDYENAIVRFSRSVIVEEAEQTIENIKISRGEETLFIWCFFLAICQLAIDKDPSYDWVKYIYIDDPISSLDENNAIAIACDFRFTRYRRKRNKNCDFNPSQLFFNVLFNEPAQRNKNKRYFLHYKEPNDYAMQRHRRYTILSSYRNYK